MGPAGWAATRMYRRALDDVERGAYDAVLGQFHPDCAFTFIGDSPLGAQLRGHPDIRRWFERFGRLLPGPRFEVQQIVVGGAPWRQRLVAHVRIHGTVAGEAYENQFAHFLTIRWGKVVDDLVVEDTQRWERACRRLVAAGVTEAAEGPLAAGAH
ncbi:nuclear transport factor 2 family protein [Micromonosporaceae bacterium Da 78-11]